MLIVEGTDCLGKTTLCRELVKRLNSRGYPHVYCHLSKLPECFEQHLVTNYTRLMSLNTVWDRFHLSRQAYGAVARNQRLMSPHELERLRVAIEHHAGLVVVAFATDERWLRERVTDDERYQMYDLDTILRVNAEYARAEHVSLDAHSMTIRVGPSNWPSDYANDVERAYLRLRDRRLV